MKSTLMGGPNEQDGWTDGVANLVAEVHNAHLLYTLVEHLGKIDFEVGLCVEFCYDRCFEK